MRKFFTLAFIAVFCGSGFNSTVNGQGFKNATNLYIESGVVFYVKDDLDNSTAGTLSNVVGGTIYNLGEIRLTGDFNNTGTSNMANLVVLEGAGAQSVTGVSDFRGVLEVNKTGGTATVTSGTTNIHGHLRLAEGTINANGNLVIASTVAGTGLVDDFSDVTYDGAVTGNLRVQRHVTGAAGLRYIGSAVNTANVSELSEIGLYGPDGGQIIPQPDCSPFAVDNSSPYGAMFEWREQGPFFEPFAGGCQQDGWFVRSSGTMTNGRGYAATTGGVGGATFEIGGAVGNTSEISTVSNSGLSNTNANGDGYHLVSNPFPSPMQWYAAPSGFDGQAHFWQTSGAFSGTYQSILPNNGSSGLIGSSQGFFVRVSSGTANFALPQSYRRLGDPSFYKEDLSNTFDIVVEAKGFADKTRVRFGDNGETNGFDNMLDANKIKAKGAQPTLQTRFRGTDYSINSLPIEGHPMTIPMDLFPGVSGEFKFTAKYLSNFTVEAHVYLEDLKLDKIQELTINPIYTFVADESDDPDRFLLHFRLQGEEPLYTGDDILMYANDGSAYLFLPELDERAQLQVFDALGALVHEEANLSEGKNVIDLSFLATGAYVMRALVNNKPIVRKVIL
ncbi:MAG: T9SS type A sorting domain-containing protein [Flavobacteriales bacterium]|nr:T9SS type A sorting domain-containing protein [Flavobacteriales bacterium]